MGRGRSLQALQCYAKRLTRHSVKYNERRYNSTKHRRVVCVDATQSRERCLARRQARATLKHDSPNKLSSLSARPTNGSSALPRCNTDSFCLGGSGHKWFGLSIIIETPLLSCSRVASSLRPGCPNTQPLVHGNASGAEQVSWAEVWRTVVQVPVRC